MLCAWRAGRPSANKGYSKGVLTMLDKEIGLAVLGASAALAGILLVFIGLLFARSDSFPGATDNAVVDKYRHAAMIGLVPVLVCAVVMMGSYEWLFCPTSRALYVTWRWGFWCETAFFLGYASWSTWMLGRP